MRYAETKRVAALGVCAPLAELGKRFDGRDPNSWTSAHQSLGEGYRGQFKAEGDGPALRPNGLAEQAL